MYVRFKGTKVKCQKQKARSLVDLMKKPTALKTTELPTHVWCCFFKWNSVTKLQCAWTRVVIIVFLVPCGAVLSWASSFDCLSPHEAGFPVLSLDPERLTWLPEVQKPAGARVRIRTQICLIAKPFPGSFCPPCLLPLANVDVCISCIFWCFAAIFLRGHFLPTPNRFQWQPNSLTPAPGLLWRVLFIKPTQSHLLKLQSSW